MNSSITIPTVTRLSTTVPPLSSLAAQAAQTPRMQPEEPLVRFIGVQKTYDGIQLVVRQLDLDIRRGEFLTLLGPSGSGKTTTLMMLAGFESPTAGEILLDGKPISIISVVVLPDPEGPSRVRNSPRRMSRSS